MKIFKILKSGNFQNLKIWKFKKFRIFKILKSENLLEIEFKDIFPKSLSGVNFTSTTDDSEPVIGNATFAFTSYDIKKLWLIFNFFVLYFVYTLE